MTDMTDDFGPEHPRGRVLVIAGSDSSGGAGIQADIKTVTALGGYAATAITAVTVQSTEGVSAVHPVPADVIQGQIGAVLGDIGADCIKTGMIASAGVLDAVLQAIAEQGGQTIPLIADPVMVAASGARLVDDSALEAMKTRLLPRAALVTPNIPEAEALTGLTISDIDDQRAAGEAMLKQGAGAALVKGGHGEGADVIDILVTRKGVRLFTRPRLKTRHTHGTGCTLASGIAALMAQGLPLDRAVEAAGDYLHEAIRQAPGLGKGSGPVHHGWTVQRSFASAPLREG